VSASISSRSRLSQGAQDIVRPEFELVIDVARESLAGPVGKIVAAQTIRFAAGELARTQYEAERESGKRRLRELTLARRETAPSGV